MTRFSVRYWVGAAVLLVALGVMILLTLWAVSARGAPLDAVGTPQLSLEGGFSTVIQNVLPAVVNVSSSRITRAPLPSDLLFEWLFGKSPARRERRERSLGSGVIFTRDGYILTNSHVVERATDVRIFRDGQRELQARIVGVDPKTDIAVLKIEERNLPVIAIGDSSKVRVGEFTLAVGDPFGIGQTVTMGIVSAVGRGGFGIEDIEDFIQTDAAINPGNSGGALVNVRGELIGINTAILSGSGGNQGVGFAVPVNMARSVMDQIVKTGKVSRGWLGIVIQPVTPVVAKAFGLSGEPRGALIGDLAAKGPAATAGIQRGDIVLAVNGEAVRESRDLQLKTTAMPPGTKVIFTVFRDSVEREVPVTLGEVPAEAAHPAQPAAPEAALTGLSVEDLTPEIAREIDVPIDTCGVVVSEVEPGSLAAEIGLRPGDVIQEVNRKPVNHVADFERATREAGRAPVVLLVNRAGNTLFVPLEPR